MNHDRTYRPVPYVPAPRLRDADGSLRQAPCRSAGHAATYPVQPLKGLPGTRATDVSYRASVPGGAGTGRRVCTGTSESRPTAHYSLLTANSTYTFSAKEKDSETGLSYFGSRYYSSDLSVWLSVDPMSDKYPSLSPYVYCADNSVKLVDPNGEEIIIEWQESQYRYEKDGTLTHIKGTVLNERQLNRFINKAKNSLDKINKTTEGKRMIVDLQNSGTSYKIKAGASGYEKNKQKNTITWNSNGTKMPVQDNPFGESNGICDLAHELSHAFDKNNNWTDDTPVDGLKKSEWVACYRENLIRKELGLRYRTYYKKMVTPDGAFLGGLKPYLLNENGTGPYLPFDIKSYEKQK